MVFFNSSENPLVEKVSKNILSFHVEVVFIPEKTTKYEEKKNSLFFSYKPIYYRIVINFAVYQRFSTDKFFRPHL